MRSIRAGKWRVGLTKAGQSAYSVSYRLQQDFHATRKPEKWVTDTTYIPTREGWLYLVSVMDLFSRQVVGWAMGEHRHADLAGYIGAGHGDWFDTTRSRLDRAFQSGQRVRQCQVSWPGG